MEEHPNSALVVERLAASLAHALASPLSLIKGRLDLLVHDTASLDVQQSVQQLQDQIQRIVALLECTQTFGKRLRPKSELASLKSELTAFEQAFAPTLASAGVTLEILPAAGTCEARIPRTLLADVLRGVSAFLRTKGPGAVLSLDLSHAARNLDCLRLGLSLRPDAELASTRHALMDPWLEEPTEDAPARLELALALGVLQNLGGWYERGQKADQQELILFLPLRP